MTQIQSVISQKRRATGRYVGRTASQRIFAAVRDFSGLSRVMGKIYRAICVIRVICGLF
jgi:hypothetical protein